MAYLIDRRGSSVTSGEIRAVLWEGSGDDEKTADYLQKLKKDLVNTLKKAGVESVFVTGRIPAMPEPENVLVATCFGNFEVL